MELEFISTKRGGRSLLNNGRRYHRKKFYANGGTFWLCFNNSSLGCKGSVSLNDRNEVVKTKIHIDTCKEDFSANKILKELDTLKSTCSHNFESIQKQYENMVFSLEDEGIDFLQAIPGFENVKTGLYNERNRVLGAPKLRFKSCKEVIIPEKFKTFLLAEYEDDDKKILLFCSQKAIRLIKKGRFMHILGDGTFSSSPKGFKQLYTIHGVDEHTSNIIPLIYCLLPDKKLETYTVVFRIIKSQFQDWQPEKITVDFELAPMKAIRRVFPSVVVKGCFYHLNRCLFRKAKALKITTRVKRRHVARCASLARLPKEYIQTTGITYVMSKSPPGHDVTKFNHYFKKQWMIKTDFVRVCNCSEEKIRTTNNIEGWHSRLNRFVGRKNPTLAQLLEILSKETKLYNIFKKRTKMSKEYQEIEAEIKQSIVQLNLNEITVGHCIELISPFRF